MYGVREENEKGQGSQIYFTQERIEGCYRKKKKVIEKNEGKETERSARKRQAGGNLGGEIHERTYELYLERVGGLRVVIKLPFSIFRGNLVK